MHGLKKAMAVFGLAAMFIALPAVTQSIKAQQAARAPYDAGSVLGTAGCYELTPIGTLVLYVKPDLTSFDRASCARSWAGGPQVTPGDQSILMRWGYFEIAPGGNILFYPQAHQ